MRALSSQIREPSSQHALSMTHNDLKCTKNHSLLLRLFACISLRIPWARSMRSKCSRSTSQSHTWSSQYGRCWTTWGRQDSTSRDLVSRSNEKDTDGRDKASLSVSVHMYTSDDYPKRSARCVSLCCYRLTVCPSIPENHSLDDGKSAF